MGAASASSEPSHSNGRIVAPLVGEACAVATSAREEGVISGGMIVLLVRGRRHASCPQTTKVAGRQGQRCCLVKGDGWRLELGRDDGRTYRLKSRRSCPGYT